MSYFREIIGSKYLVPDTSKESCVTASTLVGRSRPNPDSCHCRPLFYEADVPDQLSPSGVRGRHSGEMLRRDKGVRAVAGSAASDIVTYVR